MTARKSAPGKKPAKKAPAKKAAAKRPPPKKTSARSSGVEHGPDKAGVGGSKPSARTNKPARKRAAPKPAPSPVAQPPEVAATVRKLLRAPSKDPNSPMTPDVEAFITEYLLNGLNGTAAWLSIHPEVSPATASTMAWKWLRKVEIRQRIDAVRSTIAASVGMTRDEAVAHLRAIIDADPSELTQLRRVRCPGCWSGKQSSMWTEPQPDCQACEGEGIEQAWFADTRKLSPALRALFGGVKVTQQGIQMLMESKDAARDKLFKIQGLYQEDNEQKGKPLAEAAREFFAALHGNRLPIAQPNRQAPPSPPGPADNPLVSP